MCVTYHYNDSHLCTLPYIRMVCLTFELGISMIDEQVSAFCYEVLVFVSDRMIGGMIDAMTFAMRITRRLWSNDREVSRSFVIFCYVPMIEWYDLVDWMTSIRCSSLSFVTKLTDFAHHPYHSILTLPFDTNMVNRPVVHFCQVDRILRAQH
jgi:hypothetical protein